MIKIRSRKILLAGPSLALLLLAACGSGSGGGAVAVGESPATSSQQPSTPASPSPTAPADPAPAPTAPETAPTPAPESPTAEASAADEANADASIDATDAAQIADKTTAVITGVSFKASSHRRAAQGSDNWPLTWSNDNHQYAVWGDGGGFGGTESSGRASFGVARVEGDSSNYRGVNRFGGKGGACKSTITGKGHGAPISIRGWLYVWVTPGAGAQGYQRFRLYRSGDKGCTWKNLAVEFVRSRDSISYGSFVQFGRDNTSARDAYVYTVAAEVTNTSSLTVVQKPGRVMLVRVPMASIADRGAYEFFAGLDSSGQPKWSTDPAKRRPIYQDKAGVGPFPQMTFVPGLDRMVYTNQHGPSSGNAGAQSLLTMAEAPQPWGPWHVFYRARFQPQIEQTVFQWNFAPKWFRNGGRNFTLTFSGHDDNDSWNTIDGTLATQ